MAGLLSDIVRAGSGWPLDGHFHCACCNLRFDKSYLPSASTFNYAPSYSGIHPQFHAPAPLAVPAPLPVNSRSTGLAIINENPPSARSGRGQKRKAASSTAASNATKRRRGAPNSNCTPAGDLTAVNGPEGAGVFGVGPCKTPSEPSAAPARYGSLLHGSQGTVDVGSRNTASDVWFATIPVSADDRPETLSEIPEPSLHSVLLLSPRNTFFPSSIVSPWISSQLKHLPCRVNLFSSGKETNARRRSKLSPENFEKLQVLKFVFRNERLLFENDWCEIEEAMLPAEHEADLKVLQNELLSTTVPTI